MQYLFPVNLPCRLEVGEQFESGPEQAGQFFGRRQTHLLNSMNTLPTTMKMSKNIQPSHIKNSKRKRENPTKSAFTHEFYGFWVWFL